MKQESCEKCGNIGILEKYCAVCRKTVCSRCIRGQHECCEKMVVLTRESVLESFAIAAEDYGSWGERFLAKNLIDVVMRE